MYRKTLALMLAFVMVFGSFSFVSAQTGNEKVDWLIDEGLVLGDAGGYRLNDPIRRSEVATMVTRALDAESAAELLAGIPSAFPDVQVGFWANGYINYATSMQYVNGYPDGTFGPDRNITYAEMITILVRTTGEEVNSTVGSGEFWATPYVIKAIELGITEGVSIPGSNYNASATREKVFEMIYNTVMNRLMADREVYQAIFVENERTGNLDEDEMSLVILDEGTNSPDATLRYEKDDQVEVTLGAGMDPETLLGKVAYITIDKDDRLISVAIDTSFGYHTGPFAAMDMEIMLNNGDYYDVIEEVRSSRSIEKLYGVYLNEEAYDYLDYVADNDDSDGSRDGAFVAEFARVTVKGDSVFFIDAYMFDDIAPVMDVEDDGEEIIVRSDYPSAGEEAYFLDRIVGFQNGDLFTMALDQVDVDDVLHVYGENGIVRTDGRFTGEYDRVRESNDVYYVEIDGDLYLIRATNNKRPVYSVNGANYFTLNDMNASDDLVYFEDEDVNFILDVNDSLQLMSGQVEVSEKMVLVSDSGTRDIKVLLENGSLETYRTDNFSTLLRRNPNGSAGLDDFTRGSIAYLIHDGSLIDRLVRVATPEYIEANAEEVLKDSRGRFEIDQTRMTIGTESNIFDYNSNTNVYVVNTEDGEATRIDNISIKELMDTIDEDSDLRALVISNKDFTDLNLGNQLSVGNSVDVAHTIIFTDFVLDDEFVDVEVLLLEYTFNPSRDDVITGLNSEGDSVDLQVAGFAVLPSMSTDEIVELVLEDGEVIAASVLLDSDSEEYEVTSISLRNERISLDGEDYWLAPNYKVFGDSSVSAGDTVSVVFNPEVDIEVEIIYVR